MVSPHFSEISMLVKSDIQICCRPAPPLSRPAPLQLDVGPDVGHELHVHRWNCAIYIYRVVSNGIYGIYVLYLCIVVYLIIYIYI